MPRDLPATQPERKSALGPPRGATAAPWEYPFRDHRPTSAWIDGGGGK